MRERWQCAELGQALARAGVFEVVLRARTSATNSSMRSMALAMRSGAVA